MKRLQRAVQDYLTMRRGLGFKMARHEVGLPDFVSFLERKRSPHITVKLALEWATQHAHHTPSEWATRLTVVRGFARHWSATDPLTEVPPLGLLPFRPQRAQPYFYSHQEIRELLNAAKTRPSIVVAGRRRASGQTLGGVECGTPLISRPYCNRSLRRV
jgi:integrase/recombinase XerD